MKTLISSGAIKASDYVRADCAGSDRMMDHRFVTFYIAGQSKIERECADCGRCWERSVDPRAPWFQKTAAAEQKLTPEEKTGIMKSFETSLRAFAVTES